MKWKQQNTQLCPFPILDHHRPYNPINDKINKCHPISDWLTAKWTHKQTIQSCLIFRTSPEDSIFSGVSQLFSSEVGKAILLAVDEFLGVWSSLSRCVVDLSRPPLSPTMRHGLWRQLRTISSCSQDWFGFKNQLKEPQNMLCHSIQHKWIKA